MDGEDNKHPRDVGGGTCLVTKKAKCSGDPCCDFAQLTDLKKSVDKETDLALFAAKVATHRSQVNKLAKYVEFRCIAQKHIHSKSKAVVDEVSLAAQRFLEEVERGLFRICRDLAFQMNIEVGSVSELKGVHYMVTNHGWEGKAVIFVDECGGIDSLVVKAVRDAAKDLNVTLRCLTKPILCTSGSW